MFVVSLFSQLPEYGDESLRVCVGVAHLLGLLPVSRTGPVSGISLVRSRSALPIFAFFSSRAYIYIIYRAAAILKSSLDIGTVYHIIRCKDMGFEFFQQIFYTFFSIHRPFYKKKLKISGKRTIRRAKRSKKMLRNKKYGALKHLQSAYAHVKMVLLTEL